MLWTYIPMNKPVKITEQKKRAAEQSQSLFGDICLIIVLRTSCSGSYLGGQHVHKCEHRSSHVVLAAG